MVETAEGSSYPRRFTAAAHAPGVFTASGAGTSRAAAVRVMLVEVPAGIEPSAAAEVLIAIGGRESQPGVTVAVE